MECLNLLAIIASPIIAVLVGQHLQERAEKRRDKLEIFKILMTSRNSWDYESVKALNVIDIVFSDDKDVRICWKEYYDKLCIENPTAIDLAKIKISHDKFLEVIANSLGYKDKVTWETIQNPYVPKGMREDAEMRAKCQQGQIDMAELAKHISERMFGKSNGVADNSKDIDAL